MIMHEGAKAYSIGRNAYVDLCTVYTGNSRVSGDSRVLSTTLVVIPISSRVASYYQLPLAIKNSTYIYSNTYDCCRVMHPTLVSSNLLACWRVHRGWPASRRVS